MPRQLYAPYSIAGFIVPYQCYEFKRKESTLDRNKMRIRKGKLRLSPNEEAQLIKEETEKRRKLRLQQVREQSKENAAKIRNAVKQEKHRQLLKLANEIKGQLEAEKAERVRHLEQQYDNSLRNIGVGHKMASEQPDWCKERQMIQQAENLRSEARGQLALEKEKRDIAEKKQEARKHVVARKNALEVERQRSAEIAAMPPPPPDPLQNINLPKPRAVKVTDMEHFSNSHYHLQNEHVIDKAGPEEQEDAREAAELEAERIKERALELKRLRQDQLERARLRHNQALERELLKHDYNNILHDLSDLQRGDRERRLKVVHNIPKQVYEPPNFRMEDRDDKQRQMEQDFEDMYMAGTDYQGDINMTLGPTPHPGAQTTDDSLDVTLTENGTPLREPMLPGVPPVLRDMTNMPRAKSPGKKPEKVLRSLMDKIKTQREDWINSHSVMEVGEPTQQLSNGGEFVELLPETSPAQKNIDQIPAGPGFQLNRQTAMPSSEFSANLRAANERQQTNVQVAPEPVTGQQNQPIDLQQIELAEILKQQEIILEQKKQLELKLQQLSQEQQKIQTTGISSKETPLQGTTQPQGHQQGQLAQQSGPGLNVQGHLIYQNGLPKQQTNLQIAPIMSDALQTPMNQTPVLPQQQQQQAALNQQQLQKQQQQILAFQQQQQQQIVAQNLHHQQIAVQQQQQQFVSSLSSSGMSSQHPMNSIPPTGTTNSVPMATMAQGPPRVMRSAYQPASAVLTTEQLGIQTQLAAQYPSQHQQYDVRPTNTAQNMAQLQGQYHGTSSLPNGWSTVQSAPMTTNLSNQTVSVSSHVTPGSLTSEAHNAQMQRIREYQQQLLMRHEQSKRVLEETKAEIKKRRENLMQRYPKLDLTRLEDLGAKYLQNGQDQLVPTLHPGRDERGHDQTQTSGIAQASTRTSQGSGVPVTQLLASLASHPYYKATLSQTGAPTSGPVAPSATHITIGSVHIAQPQPEADVNANLKKNKFDGIRKSLPFDADESFQNKTAVRVYEAYSQKQLDTTSGTEPTDVDTSALTDKESPAFRNMSVAEDTDVDTTLSGSFLSDRKDPSHDKQEELRLQLLEIQRQKEEIIKRHEMGQQKLQQKEMELKQKLATVVTTDVPVISQDQIPPPSTQTDFLTQNGYQPHNLSTILEVDTPASTRPSDTGRLSTSSSESGSVSYLQQPAKRAQDFLGPTQQRPRVEVIAEEPKLEDVETLMEKQKQADKVKEKGQAVADYSGKNIDNVLERAKRFEAEVLEKLRKQTNAVLYDNEFDDSLEFNTSRRRGSAEKLSSDSLSTESLSTGPLDDSDVNRSQELSVKTTSTSKTWADELSQYKTRTSEFSDKSFKEMHPDLGRDSTGGKAIREDTIFTGDVNRFAVYSKINDLVHSDRSSPSSDDDKRGGKTEGTTLNAEDMMNHLRDLQRQLQDEGEAREALARQLQEVQKQSASPSTKLDVQSHENDDGRFMADGSKSDLSQYSLTDKSTDTSINDPSKVKITYESPVQSGASSREKELPLRRSPIGDNARSESPAIAGTHQMQTRQEVTSSEYSYGMEESKQRSTSTPGDERRASSLGPQMSGVNQSELPSEITVRDKTVDQSSGVRFSGVGSKLSSSENMKKFGEQSDLSSYTVSSMNESSKFDTLSPEKSVPELTTHSFSDAEESLNSIKEEFKKLAPVPAQRQKIKTYAVSRDGDLISEQSDSDRSSGNFMMKTAENLSTSTMSRQGDTNDTRDFGLSSYAINNSTKDDKQLSQLSQYTIKSSEVSDSSPRSSNPQSSSFTNITSDPSFNASGLSQYTPADKNENKSQTVNDSNYLQQKFESLDNLISQSKSLIARHKVIIDKNKQVESELAAPPIPTSLPPPLKDLSKGHDTEELVAVTPTKKLNDDSQHSKLSSLNESSKTGNQSSDFEFKSLDYVTEHCSGIMEEQMPDLSTMTLGSELSITEAFNKTELSDSGDSLKSFEKHEMSECESLTTSHTFEDDAKSKSDSVQDIVEARKLNFMVQSERVAAAAKERALSKGNKAGDEHPVFRAVPVNVVAAPTLSMSVNVPGTENGKVPSAIQTKANVPGTENGKVPSAIQTKATGSVSAAKKNFEAKEKENTLPVSSKLPLNRALQPRGPESPRQQDGDDRLASSSVTSRGRELSGASGFTRSLSAPVSSGKSALLGEIKNFGGASGLTDKPQTTPPKRTPPKVLPKPVRNKVGFSPTKTENFQKLASAPPSSGFSKTLSSWKKSRAVTSKSTIPEPVSNIDAPKNSVRVLPKEAPVPLTAEERKEKMEEQQYEKNIRAYNPRLFRLQHKLDTTDEADTSREKAPDKPKETKRDTGKQSRK